MKYALFIAIYMVTSGGGMTLHKEYIHATGLTGEQCEKKQDQIGHATHDLEYVFISSYCVVQK